MYDGFGIPACQVSVEQPITAQDELPDARYMLVRCGDIFEPYGHVTGWAKDENGNRVAYSMSERADYIPAGIVHDMASKRGWT